MQGEQTLRRSGERSRSGQKGSSEKARSTAGVPTAALPAGLAASGASPLLPDEATFLYCIQIIWSRRYALGAFSTTAVVATLVYCLLTPKVYESTATIITHKDSPGGGMLSSLMASGVVQSMQGLSIPSMTPDLDLFVSILNSRSLGEAAIREFDLQARYGKKFVADALKRLQGAVTVASSKTGVVGVTVAETNPALAARIANFYVAELDRRLRGYGNTKAARKREFVENRLAQTREELRQAEEALRDFQKRHKAYALSEQARGIVGTAALVQADIIATSVALESMKTYASDDNPDVIKHKLRLAELRRQLDEMQVGRTARGSVADAAMGPFVETFEGPIPETTAVPDSLQVPFGNYPNISLELARLTRDVKIQNSVYTLLTQQLEEAKIAEVMDSPSIQVLDTGVPAVRKSRPAIRKNMLVAGVVSLFLGMLLALGKVYVDNLKRHWKTLDPSPTEP